MIKYCVDCKKYTLKSVCDKCNKKAIIKKPAKFSIEKDYSRQRLKSRGYL
ncbi:MAG: nucleolar RNA-binding Nop10p family protein [Candidatus Nanoarchaeia archaeon]|nr:nucleolar RNA-binding Nop10p family protein [Candidatus Nanoarchaeia archaeon]MDD5053915.1 nucleolar RNA-binding Nop10p family protein [Candidatus Nanoarchaeia archaeon]